MKQNRHIPLEGTFNLRDLGGYKTKQGKVVKQGKVFRSDSLENLSDSDLQYLSDIPLVTIVDFRSEEEVSMAPNKVPSSVKQMHNLHISPGSMKPENITKMAETIPMDNIMQKMYNILVSDDAIINQYKKLFALLQDDKAPLLFHCSAGKDRTGIASLLFLLSLGVDEEQAIEDYLLTGLYIKPKYAAFLEENPQFVKAFEVERSFAEAALNSIKAEYGTVEDYLQKALSVDLDKMKEIYLDK
ncbi:protein-tyrosine phosphatase [Dysgonomonadaceae bacterium PH5-43]|nr:protein-tyrosine phosphatase [Dysgonomonadaceae bacterium PH5-43]